MLDLPVKISDSRIWRFDKFFHELVGLEPWICQSVLINVARGGVCDQPALADLLSQRRFRAGLVSPEKRWHDNS